MGTLGEREASRFGRCGRVMELRQGGLDFAASQRPSGGLGAAWASEFGDRSKSLELQRQGKSDQNLGTNPQPNIFSPNSKQLAHLANPL